MKRGAIHVMLCMVQPHAARSVMPTPAPVPVPVGFEKEGTLIIETEEREPEPEPEPEQEQMVGGLAVSIASCSLKGDHVVFNMSVTADFLCGSSGVVQPKRVLTLSKVSF